MPTFICCGFRKNHSPDQKPARLIDTSEKGVRFQLTARNTDDTETHGAERLDHIYSEDTLNPDQDVLPFELPQQQTKHHWDRGPKCLAVTDRLKKKISSTSGASDEASTRALTSTMSIEEVEVKRKIRRAMHSKNEHDEDENANSEFYDPDAKVIKTPQGWPNPFSIGLYDTKESSGTWPRQEGTIHLSPNRMQRIMARPSTPIIQTSDVEGPPLAHPSPTRANTRILSRMLTDRASALSEPPIEDGQQPMQQGFIKSPRKTKSKNYIFSDETPRQQSPLDTSLNRSNTVIRITPTRQQDDGKAADDGDVFNAPPTPDLKALRLASISDSVVGPGWRLPSSARKDSSQTYETVREHDPSADVNTAFSTALQSQASPSRPSWMRGASGLLAAAPHERRISRHHSHCDPGSEEEMFGGIDGRDSFPQTRSHSATTNPSSVHLYSMRISERLASHGILPVMSSPQLRSDSSSDLSWKKGPDHLSLGPRRQVSDHGFVSARVPPVWDKNPRKQAASSTYSRRTSEFSTIDPSSQAASLSNRHSRLSSDREYSGPVSLQGSRRPSREANNAAATILDPNSDQEHRFFHVMRDPMIIDERKVEKQPRHSSVPINPATPSRSLTTAQIEQEEGQRFLRKAHTVTATRYFSQADLDELTAEIAKRTPARSRNVSRFDGSGDVSASLLVPQTENSLARKPSLVVGDEPVEATSWGQALQKDARRRSRSPLHLHHTAEDDEESHKHRSPKQLFQHLHHSSSEGDHLDVKAQLEAYRMRPRLSPLGPGHPAITTPAKVRREPDTSSPTPAMETAPSWRRYPSHTRSARSDSPARETDDVFSRDFASAPIPHEHHHHPHLHLHHDPADQHHLRRPGLGVTKKAQSTHFERLKDNVRELYHARSLDLVSKFAIESRGHRSSVSEGRGLEEYPELEMLPPLVVGGDGAVCGEERFVTAKTSLGDEVGKMREGFENGGRGRKARGKIKLAVHPAAGDATRPGQKRKSVDRLIAGSGGGKVRSMAHAIDAPAGSVTAAAAAAAARTKPNPGWQNMYDSCVDLRMLRSPNLSKEGVVACNGGVMEKTGDVPCGRKTARVGSSEKSGEGMRQSTLDFKRSLEEGERRSWERLRRLGAAPVH